MSRQIKTGILTEEWVEEKISALGLVVYKPVPDRGIDLIVTSTQNPDKSIKIQVKGRGKILKI